MGESADIPRLETRGIIKRFDRVTANAGIDMRIFPGEIHAVLGENGAGKSTLVKILCGLSQPDQGEILWDGERVLLTSPKIARRCGIAAVFQHFSLFPSLTVFDNIVLGLDRRVAARHGTNPAAIAALSQSYGLSLDPDRLVGDLSVGEKQRVEILRCLVQEPRLLILDEPTSVLAPQEAEQLFRTLRQVAGSGCAILYISHRLREIRDLCHSATVLAGGKVVSRCDPAQETAESLARLMMGIDARETSPPSLRTPHRPLALSGARLTIQDLSMSAQAGGMSLTDLGLEIFGGEILGIAGIAGNGQTDLFEALSGERLAADHEAIRIDGIPCGRNDPSARHRLGLSCVPEDRDGHAAVADFTLAENALLTGLCDAALTRGGFVRWHRIRARARQIIEMLKVGPAAPETRARDLSGGNLQKFVIARALIDHPAVLVVAQPCWGIDAPTAALVRDALRKLAATGSAILVISQDLDEILALCDHIAVLYRGKLTKPWPATALSAGELGLLMAGIPPARIQKGERAASDLPPRHAH